MRKATAPAKAAPRAGASGSVWLRTDLWHEFLGQPTTEFSSATGFIPFTADLEGSWMKVGLGGSWDFATDATLYGNVNYQRAFNGDSYAWEGKLGVKMTW